MAVSINCRTRFQHVVEMAAPVHSGSKPSPDPESGVQDRTGRLHRTRLFLTPDAGAATRNAPKHSGPIVSLNRRASFQPLAAAAFSAGDGVAGPSSLPTPFGVWIYTPHAANCGRAHARFLRALAGTLGALRRHFLPCLCWDGCMRHRIHAKDTDYACVLSGCMRLSIHGMRDRILGNPSRIAGNPPTLDAISTGNPGRHLPGISNELRAARQGALPFPPLFATPPPVPTRLFDLLRKCSPFPMARRLAVSVQFDRRFFSSPCSARAERTSLSSSSPWPFLSMSFRMAFRYVHVRDPEVEVVAERIGTTIKEYLDAGRRSIGPPNNQQAEGGAPRSTAEHPE